MTDASNLVIRADASADIGVGHVMRCIAIAQAWKECQPDGSVAFTCAAIPEQLRDRLEKEEFCLLEIDTAAGSSDDAAQLLKIAEMRQAAAIVLDGYQFRSGYQQAIAQFKGVTLAIDDCGDLHHYPTDFVLNQNLGASADAYRNRDSRTKLLLGTRYALLRKEFLTASRKEADARTPATRILITLGGSDANNLTGKVVAGMQLIENEDFKFRVIAGAANPYVDLLRKQVHGDRRFEVLSNVDNMATHYLWADAAIAAGGSSNWEMCYFGLPRVILVVAENQRAVARQLELAGIAVNPGEANAVTPGDLCRALEATLGNSAAMETAQNAARAAVDGLGAKRCVSQMLGISETDFSQGKILFRNATIDDWKLLLGWRNDPQTRAASRNPETIDEETHRQWLQACLADGNRQLLIAEIDSEPVGTVRIDRADESELSWTVAPHARGMGVGRQMVCSIAASIRSPLRAVVRADNPASRKIATSAGFEESGNDGSWLSLYRGPTGTRRNGS